MPRRGKGRHGSYSLLVQKVNCGAQHGRLLLKDGFTSAEEERRVEGEKTEDVDADRQPREHEHTRVLLGVAGETDAAAQGSRTLVSQRASKRAGEQKCTTFEAVPTILLDQVILRIVWKVVETEGLKSDICDEGIDEKEHQKQ